MKKDLSRRIDELIISCAIGNGCDEAELMRLAHQYGAVSNSYKFSKMMRAFDFDDEKQIASRLEKEVNDTIRRFHSARIFSELGPHGKIFKNRPKASPKKACSPKTCRCNILGGKRRTRIKSKRRH